jgi:ribonucleoside-diphosphate reductase alpha chain
LSEGINDPFQNFIALSRYARWIPEEGRREVWSETVDRAINFFDETIDIDNSELEAVRNAIVNQQVMPSMRLLMTAGEALKRNHIAAYNCSFVPVDHLRAFDEALYILMQGTGLGFSVAKKYVNKLPAIAESFHATDTTIVVGDSKEGWAKAYKELINLLWSGQKPLIDVNKVRPAGARLKTFGGRASGPEPLLDLFQHTTKVVEGAAGRQLTSLEAHSIVCKIAAVVVVGGVRRSALISLSDLEDREMAYAKVGAWYEENGHYALANNSAIYYKKPSVEQFMHEWLALVESKSGERGIFNLEASQNQAAKSGRRDGSLVEGTNPCAEILLRPYEFCNLTEVIVRADDTLETLKEKVRLAAVMGTWQSSLTDFKYIRKVWKDNVEEERLLGVSLTGQFGHKVLSGSEGIEKLELWLQELKETAVEANRVEAERIGIPQSAAVTCVKPSGTVSQLNGVSSGMHPWHNEHYIRTVRGDNKDPLTQFLIDAGIPAEPDVMNPNNTTVFSFPMKAPEGAITRKDLTAIEHLEIWLAYQRVWCEHKPSVTISVKDDEWLEVGAWVYKHFDEMSGVSFLPFSEHTYKQAPYQDITETDYNQLSAEMPKDILWSDLSFFESTDDAVNGSQELSCAAGGCDVVDIPSQS